MSIKFWQIFVIFLFVNKSNQLNIECSYDIIHPVAIQHRYYACEIYKIWNVDEPQLESVNGTHNTTQSNTDVEGLIFLVNDLKYFPGELINFFPNLISIHIWWSQINVLSSKDLEPFPKLEEFRLYDSKITSIPGDLFHYNRNLKYIGIAGNGFLNLIGENLLTEELEQLKIVHFNANGCIDREADSIKKLRELRIDNFRKCQPKPTPIPAEW